MIFVRYIPWKIMALPTPICVLLVTVLPAPFIILAESIKRMHRACQRISCKRLLKQQKHQMILLYTKRADSLELMENEVLPSLDVTVVAMDKLNISDKQYRSLSCVIPKTLGYAFPILIKLKDNEITTELLHHCVYEHGLKLREASAIRDALQEKLK